jgi:hypothetical protein
VEQDEQALGRAGRDLDRVRIDAVKGSHLLAQRCGPARRRVQDRHVEQAIDLVADQLAQGPHRPDAGAEIPLDRLLPFSVLPAVEPEIQGEWR